MPADSRPLLLLDGASLWFRAFHAIPEKITAPNGQPVNAVRGFLDMLAALLTQHRPGRVVVCLDWDWRPAFRVALLPSYKTHRLASEGEQGAEQVPSSLPAQVEVIEHILGSAGIATAGAVGFEADDVLGTLADRERSDPVIVVSGDRDLLQLVSDHPVRVRVLYVGRGLAKAELFGPAKVAAKYAVPLDNAGRAYADMAILRGDPSDGLPGVPGIGEKTAAGLISRFGSLDALLSAAADPTAGISEKIRTSLQDAAAYLSAAPRVVHVTRNAPVELSQPDPLPTEVDTTTLREWATTWNAKSPIDRLITALENDRLGT